MTRALTGRIALVLAVSCVLAGASEALAGGRGGSYHRGVVYNQGGGPGWQVYTGHHRTPTAPRSWRSSGLYYDSEVMVPFAGHPPVRVIQPFRKHPPVVLYQPIYRGHRRGWWGGAGSGGYSRYHDRGSYGGFRRFSEFSGFGGFGRSISFGSGYISVQIVLD